MNPFVIVALGVGAAILWSYTKTAAAGLTLDYDIIKFQVYKFASSGIQFRIRIKFVNSKSTALHIQMVNLKCYLDSVYTVNTSGGYNITDPGKLIGTCQSDTAFEIPANQISEKDFYAEIGYMKLLLAVGSKIFSYIQSGSSLKPKNVLINGSIKAEKINIPVTSVVAFS